MDKLSVITKTLLALIIVGAINWGLVGFFNWNLVNAIFGGQTNIASSWLSRVVYALVGLSGIGMLVAWPRLREAASKRAVLARKAEARV